MFQIIKVIRVVGMQKKTITTYSISKVVLAAVFFVAFAAILPVALSVAHAQDCDCDFSTGGGYDFSTGSGGYDFTTGSSGYDFTTGSSGYDFTTGSSGYDFTTGSSGYDFTTGSSGYDFTTGSSGYDFTTPYSSGYDFTTPYSTGSTGGGYAYSPSYSSGGSYSYPSVGYSTPSYYSSGGYNYPSYTYPSSYYYPPTTYPKTNPTPTTPIVITNPSTPSNTTVTNTNNGNTTDSYNTCSAPNSCNTTYDDHSVVNANTTISYPAPIINNNVISNPTPTYHPVYQPVYQPTYQQPVYRNPNTPYITLSQVPYTGLELGPIGQVIYWSFLVLFSLFGAYLIVVKRAHTAVARGLKSALFGSDEHTTVSHEATEQHAHEEVIETPAPANTDTTDEFILSQINRARA